MSSKHDLFAENYDQHIKAYDCYLADVLFGLSFEFITATQILLDIGIGTGLSSKLFHQAGLEVWGMDGSAGMLKICREKQLTKQLFEQDLLKMPWPFKTGQFNHVVSCGVFHFLGELNDIFAEMRRVLKLDGMLGFTVMDGSSSIMVGDIYHQTIIDGMEIYSHQSEYVNYLLDEHGFSKEKEMVCLVGGTSHKIVIARRNK